MQALFRNPDHAPLCQGSSAGGEKQVQYAGENHDEEHRLKAPHQLADPHVRNPHADRKTQRQQSIRHNALGAEKRHDVKEHQQNLRPGVQPVGNGISREILAQGNILQHAAPPFRRASSCRSKTSTV